MAIISHPSVKGYHHLLVLQCWGHNKTINIPKKLPCLVCLWIVCGLSAATVSSWHNKPHSPEREIENKTPAMTEWVCLHGRGNWKRSHTQSSHPVDCTRSCTCTGVWMLAYNKVKLWLVFNSHRMDRTSDWPCKGSLIFPKKADHSTCIVSRFRLLQLNAKNWTGRSWKIIENRHGPRIGKS